MPDSARKVEPTSFELTSNVVDIPIDPSLVSARNAPVKFTMVNALAKTPRYESAMRDVRQRSRSKPNVYAFDKMRRLADLLIACVLLTLTAPLMLLVAMTIKFVSPGPTLERQNCIARGGRRFQMLKFRTHPHDPDGKRPAWACRPTPLGEFLRRTRIEALPQLINVLRGDMSMTDPKRRSPSFLD